MNKAIKKNAPEWDPQASPTFWLNHASRLIMKRFEKDLRPLDFSMAYFQVALVLSEHGVLPQKELVERSFVEQPTMTSLLNRMERDGIISRKAHPTDGRASLISLTSRGKSHLPKVRQSLWDNAQQALAGFNEEDRATLCALMKRVIKNLNDEGNDPDIEVVQSLLSKSHQK